MIPLAIALILVACFLGMADILRSHLRSRQAIRRVLEASPTPLPPRRAPLLDEETESELRRRLA